MFNVGDKVRCIKECHVDILTRTAKNSFGTIGVIYDVVGLWNDPTYGIVLHLDGGDMTWARHCQADRFELVTAQQKKLLF